MKHTIRIFEVDKAGQTDSPPQEQESLQVESSTLALAREEARGILTDAGWQVRAISHAVDGGLVAYVVKPEQPRRQRIQYPAPSQRHRQRRESEFTRR
jgi:hypothetical protein